MELKEKRKVHWQIRLYKSSWCYQTCWNRKYKKMCTLQYLVWFFHFIPFSFCFFIPSFVRFRVLADTPRFVLTYKNFHRCFFHFEGYVMRIIIVTSYFQQDLNISDSKLSLSSDENRGTAPLRGDGTTMYGPQAFISLCGIILHV
jgi:hypothetical protein